MEQGCLSEDVAMVYFNQLLSAILHCHKKNIMHRDLKAENIVFKEKERKTIKVIDFGLGLKGINSASGICGTPF